MTSAILVLKASDYPMVNMSEDDGLRSLPRFRVASDSNSSVLTTPRIQTLREISGKHGFVNTHDLAVHCGSETLEKCRFSEFCAMSIIEVQLLRLRAMAHLSAIPPSSHHHLAKRIKARRLRHLPRKTCCSQALRMSRSSEICITKGVSYLWYAQYCFPTRITGEYSWIRGISVVKT